MFRIKRLYSFVLWTFLPLLLATFSVCLFILLMQFLWKYIDDMVGKGVDIKVLGQMFFYAANFSVPMALPIAILLASLMTFGNLGEHLELLAMKASGISLLRIMKPLIVLSIFISGIAFVFQNNVMPGVQTKLWTIMLSLRQKSPELDIPENAFFKDISGYNMFVRHKDKTGLLRNVMVYNYSKGFENSTVTLSDSGRLKMSDDKKYLVMTLYNGESFQNLGSSNRPRNNQNQIPFQRQKFTEQDILIEFDSNFNMADESIMKGREVSKNIPALLSYIRIRSAESDSIAREIRPSFVSQVYTSTFKQERSYPGVNHLPGDTLHIKDFASFYKGLPSSQKLQVLDNAKAKTDRMSNDFSYRMFQQTPPQREIILHKIELHKKFSYPITCLLFFFIGAPLGAIIRKGGLGLPAVLSVFIFIMYYTIDIFGWKMAKQGSWPVWEGMWLSATVLAALGAFLTYKAVNDSVVMNPDVWKETLQRFIGKREIRNYLRKEVIMEHPDYLEDIRSMEKWNEDATLYLEQKQKIPFYISFWNRDFQDKRLDELLISMNHRIEDMLNSSENLIIGKLMDYPVIAPYRLPFLNRPAMRWSCSIFLPIGILVYILYIFKQKQINNDLKLSMKVNEDICKELKNLQLDNEDNSKK